MKEDNNDYLAHSRQLMSGLNNSVGFVLTGVDLKVLLINEKARASLGVKNTDLFKFTDIFHLTEDYVNQREDDNSLNKFLRFHDIPKIINIIYEIIYKDKTPVQFIGFWPYNGEYKALLFHCQPVFDINGNVVAIQHTISGYSMWGIQEYFTLTESMQANFLIPMPKDMRFKVQLTRRQHEIIFLLVSGISQRMSSQILEISYGTLSRVVRESICPRFGIDDNDIDKLIKKARNMGYAKYIPQSLCRPCIIVQDHNLVVKYFNF